MFSGNVSKPKRNRLTTTHSNMRPSCNHTSAQIYNDAIRAAENAFISFKKYSTQHYYTIRTSHNTSQDVIFQVVGRLWNGQTKRPRPTHADHTPRCPSNAGTPASSRAQIPLPWLERKVRRERKMQLHEGHHPRSVYSWSNARKHLRYGYRCIQEDGSRPLARP